MTAIPSSRLRRLWLNIHLWLGVGLCLLTVPVGITGSVLVWHDAVEEMLEPQRFATTGDALGPPLSSLVETARAALPADATITQIRLGEADGDPASVIARPKGASPRATVGVWIDPPTGKVLDIGPANNAFMRLMHDFHGNLLVPQWSGRQIVGWVGVAMLILSLSGIYLWWPRQMPFARGFGWRWGLRPSANLHHLFGLWIAIPLAILSLTGMYISFPLTARAMLGSVAPLTPQAPRAPGGQNAQTLTAPTQSPDSVLLAAVLAGPAGARPSVLTLPTDQGKAWRVTLIPASAGNNVTVTVDDETGIAKAPAAPAAAAPASTGDTIARWIRWLHVGNDAAGLIWQIVIFLGGLLPLGFAITGTMMWLRRRKTKKAMLARRARALAGKAVPAPAPAEGQAAE